MQYKIPTEMWSKYLLLKVLEGTARYAGLLLAPAQGTFGEDFSPHLFGVQKWPK